MSYDEAVDSTVSTNTAIAELIAHGVSAVPIDGGRAIHADSCGDKRTFEAGTDGRFKGREILEWLGY